jgi:predicted AAA+ superfamily ATPase
VDIEKYDISLTGSNASILSREMGTHLTGRHISKELFPFSFEEYLDFSKSSAGLEAANEYLDRGGFPAYLKSGYPEVLTEVLNDIIYRDISVRFGVRNHQALQRLAIYLISNVGKRITANSLLKLMPVASTSTMMEYLNYFENAYLVFFVQKFSYSYRKQIQNPRKVYAIDTGLVFVNSISHSQDRGRRFENMVFLSLRRKYSEIFYFSERGECDFVVCQKGKPKLLIQACVQLSKFQGKI